MPKEPTNEQRLRDSIRVMPEQSLEGIRTSAELLVRRAAEIGVVLTISQKPLTPLAMGHYESVASVRPARAMAAKSGIPNVEITKHFKNDAGVWRPVILDPMGDKELMTKKEFCENWLAEQRNEQEALLACGAAVSLE